MKIISVKELALQDIKVIRFARFCDRRGFFTESYNKKDLAKNKKYGFLGRLNFVQINESFSKKNTIRGLHFQWNPYMGKLIRTVEGHMVDLILDIRKKSPTFKKIIAHNMLAENDANFNEWIWVPPGFAHGNFFLKNTRIEYLCTGVYNPDCEAGISPLAEDIDWSLCDPKLKKLFDKMVNSPSRLMSDKDRDGQMLETWLKNPNSKNFVFKK